MLSGMPSRLQRRLLAHGQAALEELGAQSYDLVVSDMKMPGLDGPALHREVERLYPHLARRFVFLTGDLLSPQTRSSWRKRACPASKSPSRPRNCGAWSGSSWPGRTPAAAPERVQGVNVIVPPTSSPSIPKSPMVERRSV